MECSIKLIKIYINFVFCQSYGFKALISLQELVRLPLRKSVQFIYRKSSREYFRETLRDIKNRNIYSIIVDTRPESLPLLLTAVSFLSIILKFISFRFFIPFYLYFTHFFCLN